MTSTMNLLELVMEDVRAMYDCILENLAEADKTASKPHKFQLVIAMEEQLPDTDGSDGAALAGINEKCR